MSFIAALECWYIRCLLDNHINIINYETYKKSNVLLGMQTS